MRDVPLKVMCLQTGPHLVVLFGKLVESVEGRAGTGETHHWEHTLKFLFCLCDVVESLHGGLYHDRSMGKRDNPAACGKDSRARHTPRELAESHKNCIDPFQILDFRIRDASSCNVRTGRPWIFALVENEALQDSTVSAHSDNIPQCN